MPTKSPTKKKKVATKAKKLKIIGKVVHYYDNLGVAIVKLASPLRVGDAVLLKHGEQELIQSISSLELNHESIKKAKKGDIIGLKTDEKVKEGTLVVAA